MGTPVITTGTLLTCKPWGTVPMPMNVLPLNRVMTGKLPTATMTDTIPFLNIPSFIMCTSKLNPAVISIMASTLGAVQMAPCVPAPAGPWMMAGMRVLAGKKPVVTKSSCLMCMWAGMITPMTPVQMTTLSAAP